MPLAERLRADGYEVWTDVVGIRGGAVWVAEIEKALQRCDIVIAVVSEAAKRSEWVANELLYAKDLRKTIIPVVLESVALPLMLYNLQAVEFAETEASHRQIQAALQTLITPEPSISLALPPSSERGTSPLSLIQFRRQLLQHSEG